MMILMTLFCDTCGREASVPLSFVERNESSAFTLKMVLKTSSNRVILMHEKDTLKSVDGKAGQIDSG